MSWVICRNNPEKRAVEYVAPQGSERSFTPFISRARRYATRQEAESDCCVINERVVAI